jgi:hypothetical protein
MTVCQDIAEDAAGAGLDGVLAPAVALPGCRTLAVFPRGMPKVHVELEKRRCMPGRLLNLIDHMRVPPKVKRALEVIAGEVMREGAKATNELHRRRSR